MSEREYSLLAAVRGGQISDWRSLDREEVSLLIAMKKQGLVFMDAAGNVTLDPDGYTALAAYEDQLEYKQQQRTEDDAAKRAERAYLDKQTKKQFRHDWRIAVFEIFAAAILGAILDHFFNVVSCFSDLWTKIFH